MNELKLGIKLLSISSVVFGATLISVAIYSQNYVNSHLSWRSEYNLFYNALLDIGIIPLIISLIFAILGFCYIGKYHKEL